MEAARKAGIRAFLSVTGRSLKPHANPTAVRLDELNAGGFQGAANGVEIVRVRRAGPSLEIDNRLPGYGGQPSKLGLAHA